MIVGLAAPTLNAIVSLVIGVFSGYGGGKFDLIMQRFVDSWMAFPSLIIYLSIMAVLGGGMFQVVLVLGISGGITSSRTIRSAVLSIKANTYVEAARAIGSSVPHLLFRHILPNIMPMVIILFSMHIASAILAEATLSFLGFGIPPPNPTWGGMLSGSGRRYMEAAPWMALWPGFFLSIVVYGASMLGDAVRDLLDPRLKGGIGKFTGYKNIKMAMKRRNSQ
jgi:peptide/nickel transport system permease protein